MKASRGSRRASRPARRSSPTTSTQAACSDPLEALGFHVVGYGCTTCIGNSGPLPEAGGRRRSVTGELVAVASVLSGNRNFEGRMHAARARELPRVAAARRRLRARRPRRLRSARTEPLGDDARRRTGLPARRLADVGPRSRGGRDGQHDRREMFVQSYDDVFEGPDELARARRPERATFYAWDADASTYVQEPAVLRRHGARAGRRPLRTSRTRALPRAARRQRHDRPHLARRRDQARQPAGDYLQEHGVEPATSTPTAPVAATTR